MISLFPECYSTFFPCYLLVCSNDHLVLFNSDLEQKDTVDVYSTLFDDARLGRELYDVSTREQDHLEGRQTVQTREVFNVSCCNVETGTVPRTAHVSF